MLSRLKLHAFLNSFANNFANPYFSYVITRNTDSNLLVGYVQGINFFNSIAQILAGNYVDKKGKRIAILLISSIAITITFMFLFYETDPIALSLLFTLVVLFQGIYGGAWGSLLGEISDSRHRGEFLSSFALITGKAGLLAMLITIPISYIYDSFRPAFLISGFLFLVSAFVLLGAKEIKVDHVKITVEDIKIIKEYYIVTFVYGIFWGFAWPLFTITQVRILNMKPYEYAIANVIATVSTLLFQPLAGKLVDKDRRLSMFFGKFFLIVFPIGFYFASSPVHIYILNAFTGLIPAMVNIAYSAYLYDIVPAGYRGRFAAEYGLINNTAIMIGSLTSTYMVDRLSPFFGLASTLGLGYMIAILGRGSTSFLYLRLNGNRKTIEELRKGKIYK